MTNEEKLEFVTNENGSVNLSKLRMLEKKTGIVPLERIDHSQISYKKFTKNFYAEAPGIEALSVADVDRIRREKQIFVKGELVAKPLTSFADLLDTVVDKRIVSRLQTKYEITEPTHI